MEHAKAAGTAVLVGICLGFVALAASFLVTPKYKATTIVKVVRQGTMTQSLGAMLSRAGGLAAIAGGAMDAGEDADTIALLRSRQFTVQFIKRHSVAPLMYVGDWDKTSGAWKDPDDEPTANEQYLRFDRKIRDIRQDDKTGLISISVTLQDPVVAADLANAIVREFNDSARAVAIDVSRRKLAAIASETSDSMAVELRQQMGAMQESELRRIVVARVEPDFVLRTIDPAVPPDLEAPNVPDRALMFAAAFFVGTLVTGLWLFVARSRAWAP